MISIRISWGKFKNEDITFGNGNKDMFIDIFTQAKNFEKIIERRNEATV